MSGGIDAPLPFHDESGHIVGQKEEGYFNLHVYSEKYKTVALLSKRLWFSLMGF